MAESELSLTWADIKAVVGFYVGFGPESRPWTTPQQDRMDLMLRLGYAQALKPPPLPGKEKAHLWRFLEPIDTVTTADDDYDIDLPADFGGIIGPLTWSTTGGSRLEIPIINEGQIRAMRQNNTLSGRPQYAAVRPKAGFTGAAATAREMIFYPTPDATYVFTYKKRLLVANKLDSGNTYPVGGMDFAQLVLASCLAVAEREFYRGQTDKQGLFIQELAAAVSKDSSYAPDTLGPNLDQGRCDVRNRRGFYEGQFTHNGNPTG